ncbi:hypothetical protein DVR11_22210 [Paracoccus versutus]|nr:hypothetical protein DVR11_22210 [Paracoccus versutus]
MGQGYVPELHDPNRCKAKEQLSASLADDDAHHLFEAVVAALDAERRFDLPAACMLGKSGAARSRRSRDRRRCSAASSDRTAVLAATICQGLAETRIIVERWRCH